MRHTHYFYASIGGEVDLKNRRINGFAVATIGPALGKGEDVDLQTLQQLVVLGSKGKIRVRFNHPDGDDVSANLDTLVGYAENFKIDGNICRADFQAVSSEANPNSTRLLHLAKDAPEVFGASMVFDGRAVNGKTRIENLYAVDFVDVPAANPAGVFSVEKTMSKIKMQRADGKTHFEVDGKKYDAEGEDCGPLDAKKGEDGKYYVECNSRRYEVTFPPAEVKKDSASVDDPAATDKTLTKNSATVKTFSQADVDAVKADESKKLQTYSAEFDGAMTAAGSE